MVAETPGGGGWGNPFTRDPQLVVRDVRDGIVSRESAESEYGVVIYPNKFLLDTEATLSLRSMTNR